MLNKGCILLVVLLILIIEIICENTGINDEIVDLPGLSVKPKFRQYSGYLNASEDKQFHYWFVESQSNPKTDPVILWLNGGPGCSSLGGFLTENGPFRVAKGGKNLTYNNYSWNSVANVIYLESPAGVGYSYRKLNPKNLTTGDDQTAKDNYLALLHFFEKFPQFKQNNFYMTGESYAGVYIPTLALEILHDNSKINLKGVAIGNPYLNLTIMQSTRFNMAYSHGLIDTQTWNKLVADCCSCDGHKQICDFMSHSCKDIAEEIYIIATTSSGVNQYNVYEKCYPAGTFDSDSLFKIDLALRLNKEDFKFLEKFQYQFYENSEECNINSYIEYLNDPHVRDTIHIPKTLGKFERCNALIFPVYKRYNDVKKQFVELLTKYKLDPFIIYNGDLDLICDFLGNQQFLDGLEIPIIEKYKKWTLNGVTAGFVKQYRGLTFATVRGAGHMVPTDKPEAALHIVKSLIGISKLN